MEVGVMRERPSENALPLATMINSLTATVAKLATKVAKIEINIQPEPRTGGMFQLRTNWPLCTPL